MKMREEVPKVKDIINNKSGISLMTVLGVVAFWLVSLSTVLVFVFNDSSSVNRNIEYEKEYAEAVSVIHAAYQVIGPALIAGTYDYQASFWVNFHESLNITVTKNGDFYVLSRQVGLRSYSGALGISGSMIELIPVLDPNAPIDEVMFQADNILNSYLNFSGVADQNLNFSNLGQLANMNYDFTVSNVGELSLDLTGSTYSTGSLNLGGNSVTHLDTNGNMLFVDGNLDINNNVHNSFYMDGVVVVNGNMNIPNNVKLSGVVIVKGDLTIQNGVNVEGLLIVNGKTTMGNSVNFGTQQNPSFLFSKGQIQVQGSFDLYGFLFSEGPITIGNGLGNNTNQLIGGIYSFHSVPIIGFHYGPIQILDISVLKDQEYIDFLTSETSGSGSNLVVTQPKVN